MRALLFALSPIAVAAIPMGARADEAPSPDEKTFAAEPAPTKSPAMSVAGSLLTGLGAMTAGAGLSFLVLDEASRDDGAFDGVLRDFGGFLMGVAAVPMAIGIPLIVVGSSRADTTTTLRAGPAFVSIETTF